MWAPVILLGMCQKNAVRSCRSDLDTSRVIVSADRFAVADIAPTCGDNGQSLFFYVHNNLPERNDLLEMWTHTVHQVGINLFSLSV